MTEFKKIYELEVVDKVEDTDLFIVETAYGTRATKISTFKASDSVISSAVQSALDLKTDATDFNSFKTSVEAQLNGLEELLQTV